MFLATPVSRRGIPGLEALFEKRAFRQRCATRVRGCDMPAVAVVVGRADDASEQRAGKAQPPGGAHSQGRRGSHSYPHIVTPGLQAPAAVRYPRGSGPGVAVDVALTTLPMGKGEVRRATSRRTNRIAILAFGSMLHPALVAAQDLDATVANMRFVKPLDFDLVAQLALEHDALVTIEENVVAGGAGSAVAEALAAHGILIPILQLGLPDVFVDHGDPAELLANCGLDGKSIAATVNARFGQRRTDPLSKPAA